jgi:hypothetical protein
MFFIMSNIQWYWYCPDCGSGPFNHVWDACHCGGKRPEKND